MTTDVRALVREGAMSPFQIVAVAICMLINMLDGFDVLAIAFTVPDISKEWVLSPIDKGYLLAASSAGMIVGSLLLSPLADLIGRRKLVLIGLVIITVGMTASGFSRHFTDMALLRVFTGIGIGALLSSINTIVMEYSSARRKDLAVSFMAVGYPIGATIGGIITAVYLIGTYGWRSIFFLGGALSALLIPLVLWRLPESLDFLIAKRPRNALARVNELLRRMNKPQIDALPDRAPAGEDTSIRSVFDRAFFSRTLLVCTAYFLTMLPFYFALQWTPSVLVDLHLPTEIGIGGSAVLNGFGVIGGLLFGLIARRLEVRRATAIAMVMFGVALTGFGFAGTDVPLLFAFAGAMGFFMIGLISGFYATIAAMYPVRARNTGTGLALGIGRFGAMAGPYLGGLFISLGWSRPVYCAVLALPLLVAALLIVRVPLLYSSTPSRGDTAAKATA